MGQAELLSMIVPLWAVLMGVSPSGIGALIAAKSLLTLFLAIHGGAMMDRLGARRVMLFFAAFTGCVAALYPALPWFPLMILLQMLIGFSSNMSWIGAQTIIAQIGRGDPGKIGTFSFYARIGNIVAPLLMGMLWDAVGPMLSFLGITVWCSCLFFAISRLEKPATQTIERVTWRDVLPRLSDYTGSVKLIVLPVVAFTLAISFTRHSTSAAEHSFLIVYLREAGFLGTMIGAMFSAAEICNGLGSLLSGRVAKHFPMTWLMLGFTMLSILLLALTPLTGGVYALLALSHALRRGFEGIVQPLMFSLQARAVSRDLQGAVVGLRVTNNRLSSVITPLIMGLIVEFFGLANGFYAMGALLLAGCCALAIAVARSPALRTGEI